MTAYFMTGVFIFKGVSYAICFFFLSLFCCYVFGLNIPLYSSLIEMLLCSFKNIKNYITKVEATAFTRQGSYWISDYKLSWKILANTISYKLTWVPLGLLHACMHALCSRMIRLMTCYSVKGKAKSQRVVWLIILGT